MIKDKYFTFVKELLGDIETITPYSDFYEQIKKLDTNSIEFKLRCLKELHDNLFRPVANINEEKVEGILGIQQER